MFDQPAIVCIANTPYDELILLWLRHHNHLDCDMPTILHC